VPERIGRRNFMTSVFRVHNQSKSPHGEQAVPALFR
jgi:hypothetical protein